MGYPSNKILTQSKMAGFFDVKMLLSVTKQAWETINASAVNRKNNSIEAHKFMNSALIKTYDYLRNQNGEYVPNIELAEVWNIASAAVMKVDQDLGNMLYYKSRFWLDPSVYINLNREKEIIEVAEIINELERLRNKL